MLFHHDPMHSDEQLDLLAAEASERWLSLGGDPAAIELAIERAEYDLAVPAPSAVPAS